MQTSTVKFSYAPDIRFTGKKIGSVRAPATRLLVRRELDLYKTQEGEFFCLKRRWMTFSSGLGGYWDTSHAICETTDEVIDFFGHTAKAKELYAEAEIDAALEVA